MNNILIDSGFLGALYDPNDPDHQQAKTFVNEDESIHLIPQVTLPEVTFIMQRAGGSQR